MFDRHGGKVVFFGRFVSILRTYAAFLAGSNRMHWERFLVFNAVGAIVWAGIYVFAFYSVGSALDGIRGPVQYGIGAAAGLVIIAFIVWARRHEKRLEAEAEKAYPGALEDRTDHPEETEACRGPDAPDMLGVGRRESSAAARPRLIKAVVMLPRRPRR